MLLKIAAARRLLEPQSPVDALLFEVRSDMQEAVADIRRLVHALRPPVLDELGLTAALRQQAVLSSTGHVQVTVETPEYLPPLSAAVEVAAYRIAQEALTNVVRHADGSHCTVRLALDVTPQGTVLDLQVVDNGRGFTPHAHQGVGMSSMRERVEELGGTFTIAANTPSGTVVCARIPLPREEMRP
jgi:signal transduction histidine kinase